MTAYGSSFGSMFTMEQPQHQPHRRNHYGQTMHHGGNGSNGSQNSTPQKVLVRVDDQGGLPPRYQKMTAQRLTTTGIDHSLFQSSLTEPKQIQTGTFISPHTGEVIPIMEKELPPPNTTMGFIPPDQLKHTNHRMIFLNGGVDHNKPQRHKKEVLNDEPTRADGPNVFGSQLYTAQIRERQEENFRRQQFMNRNGITPDKHEYAHGEHKIQNVRFIPALAETQQLDTRGWMPNAQAPNGQHAGVIRPGQHGVSVPLKEEIRQSQNTRVPLHQPVSHLNIPMPQGIAPTNFSLRNDPNDPHQGQIHGGHIANQLIGEGRTGLQQPTINDHNLRVAMENRAGTGTEVYGQTHRGNGVHHTASTFSWNPEDLRSTLKPQQEATHAVGQNITTQVHSQFMVGSEADSKNTAIKQANVYSQGSFHTTAPVYGVRSDTLPTETKDTTIKQAHQSGHQFSTTLSNMDWILGGSANVLSARPNLDTSAAKMLTQQAEVRPQGQTSLQVAGGSHTVAEYAQTYDASVLKQGLSASGLQNLVIDTTHMHVVDSNARLQTVAPVSKTAGQYEQTYQGSSTFAIPMNHADAHRSQLSDLPMTQKQQYTSAATSTHVQLPVGTGDLPVFQLAESERSLYSTKNGGAYRDQSHQNIQHSVANPYSVAQLQTNDLLANTHRQQMGTSLDHLQITSTQANVSQAGLDQTRVDPFKQQHYQTNVGGVQASTPALGHHAIMADQAGIQSNPYTVKNMNAQHERPVGMATMDFIDTANAQRRAAHTQVQLPQRVGYVEETGRQTNRYNTEWQTGTSQGFEGGLRENQKSSLEAIATPLTGFHSDLANGVVRNASASYAERPTERSTAEFIDPYTNVCQQRFTPGMNTSQLHSVQSTYGSYDLHSTRGVEETSVKREMPRGNINMRMSPRIIGHLPETRSDREQATPTRFKSRDFYGAH